MLGLSKSKEKDVQGKILIVDDEPDLVDTIRYRLEFSGYEVLIAENGKEGLEKAESEKPDIILLDYGMPVMDGHEMLVRLRNHPDLKEMAVIMVTASSEAQDIEKTCSWGITDYIIKPFDFAVLLDKVASVLDGSKVSKI
jgi:DNA-binding response OmpR family regulator